MLLPPLIGLRSLFIALAHVNLDQRQLDMHASMRLVNSETSRATSFVLREQPLLCMSRDEPSPVPRPAAGVEGVLSRATVAAPFLFPGMPFVAVHNRKDYDTSQSLCCLLSRLQLRLSRASVKRVFGSLCSDLLMPNSVYVRLHKQQSFALSPPQPTPSRRCF